ncbi:MAG TPA: PAS domain S-box protein [Candidatus Solibacter sp.]|nr:PAS domain S-box protein [Candidatus Solibacter sp.]
MPLRPSLEHNLAINPEQLTTLLECAREMLVILGSDGAVAYANAATMSLVGLRPNELVGRPLTDLLHPDEVIEMQERIRILAKAPGTQRKGRWRLRAKSGEWRWCQATLRNCQNSEGAGEVVASFLDVTDLHRMEAERQVISEVVHALNETANLDELLNGIRQALKKVLYAENCFVALHHAKQDTFYFPFFVDQFDMAPPPQKVGRSCTAFVFRTGRAMLIPQSEFDRLAREGEVELVGSPSPAWLGVPLKTPTATIGVLVVQHYENESAYDMRDLEFLDSVGGHIALAIERRRAEEALRKSESVFRLLFAHNPLPTWVMDDETLQFIQVNDAAVRQYGFSEQEFSRMSALEIRSEDHCASGETHSEVSGEPGRFQRICKHRKKDGKVIEVEVISHPLDYAGRKVRLVVAQDVSERQILEQQLRQAQKMEAVGRLAGGVAHDFNNLLMVIKGHTELLMNTLPPADAISRKIAQIDRSADRAAALTKQLLAFSRMQVLQPRVMNLNGVVEDMGRLLPRLIGEDIELGIRTARDLGTIRGDASQMEQIIMNLAVNSRDAMPTGGRLIIETSNADLDTAYNISHPIVQPGRYVLLAVSDTGKGMDADTQAHIFEPFFTTKEPGKGTGLGLATVYGVVKQSGGFIWVYSEVGKGTTFKIYLPRVDEPEDKGSVPLALAEAPRGTETILLAEDEQDVREVAREFLESGGYRVIEARNGAEALRLANEHTSTIDLLVTDMVMPGMTGRELAQRVQHKYAGLGVIYMSGYTEHTAVEAEQGEPNLRLLTKPFSRGSILRSVREVLNLSRSA